MPAIQALLSNWKPILLGLAILLDFAAGWHARGVSDQAAHAKALQAQIDADRRAIDEANERAEELERGLAAERLRGIQINQKMEEAIATAHDCPVPDNLVRVLNDAIAEPAPAR